MDASAPPGMTTLISFQPGLGDGASFAGNLT